MGLCGCKLAANDQDPDSVPVTISSTPMEALLPQMLISSTEVTATFLTNRHASPFDVDVHRYNSCEDVRVEGGFRGRFVGINKISAIGDNDFLVSDSFGPCVPVIMFSPTNTWLLHANGTIHVSEIKRIAGEHDVEIYIISKRGGRNAEVAEAILKELHKYSAEIVVMDTDENIGVVVSQVSKTILVYCHGS